MLYTHKTEDGFTFRVYETMYVDYGLEILYKGESLFINPSCLSRESYGSKPNPHHDYGDWDEAEDALYNGVEDAFVPWVDADWKEYFEADVDQLIEAYIEPKILEEIENGAR